ncbi:hypothetical protein [Roseimicrobium sp. ORNL1]|uniref:hypothetical protein n=1 Tax=Roseimicrobium sp. ORNL1 TaxID=2711231 RepID=UPI0013E10C16|nr:hypothetical protein [Roseimicrobium sp. ORNL1]QIF02490.1 hypothetical protein G5S37_13455 [Roseimicrobium sp. ORNL1]
MTPTEATLTSAAVSAVISIIVNAVGILVQARRSARERADKLHDQLRGLVALLDRGLFYAGFDREDPVEMLWAITDVRTKLQLNGAAYVRDDITAKAFSEIRDALYNMEMQIDGEFPEVARLARTKGAERVDRTQTQQQLGPTYGAAISRMMGLRTTVWSATQRIHARLKSLSA